MARQNIFHNLLNTFWRQNPALLYGLSFFLGTCLALAYSWILTIPLILLYSPILIKKSWTNLLSRKILCAMLVTFCSYFYVRSVVIAPENPTVGAGIFSIGALEESHNFFSEKWIYKGFLKNFHKTSDNKTLAKNIPCIVIPNPKAKRPLANRDYLVKGTLSPSPSGGYNFYLSSKEEWAPLSHTFSFAEQRYLAKKIIGRYIDDNITSTRCASFLKGIATGEFHDKEMKFEFSRFGLQHIMAISGFHFAIVAGFFSLFFRQFIPRKPSAAFLIIILCSYFIFLGSTASIMRAWTMVLIVLGGYLLERKASGLNSLGVAIAFVLFFDPLLIRHIGFQFSMLITGSILINFSTFDTCIQRILPRRNLHEMIQMSVLDQHVYCIATFFRKALSLTLAVNIVAMPLSLYHFNKFPWMSLVYNWFFPLMVSISIMLLIAGLIFSFFPPIASIFHFLNNKFTNFMLDFAYNLPSYFDFYLRTQKISYEALILLIVTIFFCSVIYREHLRSEHAESRDFAFI